MSLGSYLQTAVKVADLAASSEVFAVKGGGQIISYFATFTDAWLTVGEVQRAVRLMGVVVHRDTIREALDRLSGMGFLEKMMSEKGGNSPARYRRKLSDAARDLQRKRASMPALRSAALREKQARRVA